jgi:hypothetical protein
MIRPTNTTAPLLTSRMKKRNGRSTSTIAPCGRRSTILSCVSFATQSLIVLRDPSGFAAKSSDTTYAPYAEEIVAT